MSLDRTPAFGELLVNNGASDDNPIKYGFYVRTVRRTGRLNPGVWIELTNKKGKFWQIWEPALSFASLPPHNGGGGLNHHAVNRRV